MKIAPPPLPWNLFVNILSYLYFLSLWKFSSIRKIYFYSINFFIINLFILYICIIFSCNYLHKTGFAIFAVLPYVTSWAMYLTAKYLWKTSPNRLRGKSMTHTTSKQELFVTLVTTVNYCHKEIYYRYYKGVLDTPLKLATIKSLKMRNCEVMLKATKI